MTGRRLSLHCGRWIFVVAIAGVSATACSDRRLVDPASITKISTAPPHTSVDAPLAAHDSATTLYLDARRLLDLGDTARSIQKLESVFVHWPRSDRAPHAMYWKAFVLDRRGGFQNLQVAQNLLELATQIAPTSYSVGDAATLLLRVRYRLASVGDLEALHALGIPDLAAWTACAESVRANRLAWAVEASQLPSMRLERLRFIMRDRNACTAPIREQVLLLLARAPNNEGVTDIVQAATFDSATTVRRTALRVLPRPAPDAARALLERVLATEQDVTSLEAAAAAWHSRADWGVQPLLSFLQRVDRNATAADYVETLLRR